MDGAGAEQAAEELVRAVSLEQRAAGAKARVVSLRTFGRTEVLPLRVSNRQMEF